MRRPSVSDIVLKALGLLLVTAAVLKGHELLTTPVANKDIWSWRPFLIFQVEFELALGIWLLSGVFKRLAWVVALGCFGLFCCVTLYKGLTGAASCGCFGTVHVNPWITLLAIDLPVVAGLVVFRPAHLASRARCVWALTIRVLGLALRALRHRTWMAHRLLTIVGRPLADLSSVRAVGTAVVTFALLATTMPILALNEPPTVTSRYEILEPETWVGKELPILKHIDIGEQLRTGNWLVVLYHHDCPDCIAAIPTIEQMARDLKGNEDFLRVALIEVPPYGADNVGPVANTSPCIVGKLASRKEWFVTTPATMAIQAANVRGSWNDKAPDLDVILHSLAGGQAIGRQP